MTVFEYEKQNNLSRLELIRQIATDQISVTETARGLEIQLPYTPNPDQELRQKHFATLLDRPLNTIYCWCRAAKITSTRINAKRRTVPKTELLRAHIRSLAALGRAMGLKAGEIEGLRQRVRKGMPLIEALQDGRVEHSKALPSWANDFGFGPEFTRPRMDSKVRSGKEAQ